MADPFVGQQGLALAERACVTLLQIHGHYPEMGRYYSEEPEWRTSGRLLLDEERWLFTARRGRRLTREGLSDFVARASALGLNPALYFNACECQWELARRRFACWRVLDAKGKPVRTWWVKGVRGEQCVLMNPDPAGEFGRFLVSSAEKLLRRNPGAHLFVDQTGRSEKDFARGGRRLGVPVEKLLRRLRAIAHGLGRALILNVPGSRRIARVGDVVTADASLGELPILARRASGKPFFFLRLCEEPNLTRDLRLATRRGIFPGTTSLDGEKAEAYRRWVMRVRARR